MHIFSIYLQNKTPIDCGYENINKDALQVIYRFIPSKSFWDHVLLKCDRMVKYHKFIKDISCTYTLNDDNEGEYGSQISIKVEQGKSFLIPTMH